MCFIERRPRITGTRRELVSELPVVRGPSADAAAGAGEQAVARSCGQDARGQMSCVRGIKGKSDVLILMHGILCCSMVHLITHLAISRNPLWDC